MKMSLRPENVDFAWEPRAFSGGLGPADSLTAMSPSAALFTSSSNLSGASLDPQQNAVILKSVYLEKTTKGRSTSAQNDMNYVDVTMGVVERYGE